jgi:predicted nuclease with TOPRIM domain
MLKKQANEIKELNALNDHIATLATNYEHLLCKFKLLSKECDELKSKLESKQTKTSDSFELDESSIPCAIPISKVDASTYCIDLIDESCSPSCNENVVVETCDYLIAKENDELKQEVKWLQERLANLMGKGKNDEEQVDIFQDMKTKVQHSQDNRDPVVKKLEKGAIVTCYKCHGEGHKFYKCPQFVKKMYKGAKKKLNATIKSSLIYTKPNRKNKIKGNTYIIKKKDNGKVVAHTVGKMKEERGWNQRIWVPKEVITNMKGPQMIWVPKAT